MAKERREVAVSVVGMAGADAAFAAFAFYAAALGPAASEDGTVAAPDMVLEEVAAAFLQFVLS